MAGTGAGTGAGAAAGAGGAGGAGPAGPAGGWWLWLWWCINQFSRAEGITGQKKLLADSHDHDGYFFDMPCPKNTCSTSLRT